jgi:hypothetical protein
VVDPEVEQQVGRAVNEVAFEDLFAAVHRVDHRLSRPGIAERVERVAHPAREGLAFFFRHEPERVAAR